MKKKWIALLMTVMATCLVCSCMNKGGENSEVESQQYSSVQSTEKESSSIKNESASQKPEESTSQGGESSETPDSSSSSSTSLNGGRLEGDNDIEWSAAQN